MSKRTQMLELADALEKENQRVFESKDMRRIILTDRALGMIIEALRAHADSVSSTE